MHPIQITVRLWVKGEHFADFDRFENAAITIMQTHGGKVLRIQQNHNSPTDHPYEIHFLEFKSMAFFESYKADPDLMALASLREKCIAKTEISIETIGTDDN